MIILAEKRIDLIIIKIIKKLKRLKSNVSNIALDNSLKWRDKKKQLDEIFDNIIDDYEKALKEDE